MGFYMDNGSENGHYDLGFTVSEYDPNDGVSNGKESKNAMETGGI